MHLSNGKTFTMTAKNISDENIYVQSVRLNGKDWNTPVPALFRVERWRND